MAKTLAKQELKTMEFKDGALADLIWELNEEAEKWCKEHCRWTKDCFDDEIGAFHLKPIERCKKIPKLYKLYWRAKSENISAISPLIIYKEKDDQPSKG